MKRNAPMMMQTPPAPDAGMEQSPADVESPSGPPEGSPAEEAQDRKQAAPSHKPRASKIHAHHGTSHNGHKRR